MSLRTWNTALGRQDLELSVQLFQEFVEYVASRSDDDFSSFPAPWSMSMSYELDSDDNDDDDDDSGIVAKYA